jgi:cytochrome c oxidase assembly factor CtaG
VEEVHAPALSVAAGARGATLVGVLLASDLTSWNLAPLQLLPTVLLSFAYYRRTRTLKLRGQPVPGWRQFLFWLGIFLLVLAINSPIDELGEKDFFFVHMTQHILLGDLAPLCFVAGLTGPVLRPVLAIRPFDRLRVLSLPYVALPIWAVNLYVWHVPFLYEAALHHSAVHALEHILFFTCGALMWSPVVETLPQPAWFGTGWKLGYVAIVRLIETVLGNVFIWSSSAFYSTYGAALPKWGISSAVQDQNLAGVVMMIEGSLVTLAMLAWLFLKLAAEGELRQELIEAGYDPVQVKRAVRYGRGRALQEAGHVVSEPRGKGTAGQARN